MPVVEGGPALHIVVMIRETADPLALFAAWLAEAEKSEPNDPRHGAGHRWSDGMPSERMVLLKGYDTTGFVFYTNTRAARAGS